MDPIIEMGEVTITPMALEALHQTNTDLERLLRNHAEGKWGQVSAQEWTSNGVNAANKWGEVRSNWPLPDGRTITILTRWNRCLTNVYQQGELEQ